MYNLILLQAQAGKQPGMLPNLILIGAILIIFYFFMIRPQQKKAKDQKKFRESLKKGNNVVTLGGMHGKIYEINDATVILEVDRTLKVTFELSAISQESSARAYKDEYPVEKGKKGWF